MASVTLVVQQTYFSWPGWIVNGSVCRTSWSPVRWSPATPVARVETAAPPAPIGLVVPVAPAGPLGGGAVPAPPVPTTGGEPMVPPAPTEGGATPRRRVLVRSSSRATPQFA